MEKSNGFHGEFGEEGFLGRFTSGAGSSLFFIADKELETTSVEEACEDC